MKEEQSVSEQASDLQMYRFKPMNDLRNLVVHSRWAQHVPTLGSFFFVRAVSTQVSLSTSRRTGVRPVILWTQ